MIWKETKKRKAKQTKANKDPKRWNQEWWEILFSTPILHKITLKSNLAENAQMSQLTIWEDNRF